jgi:hypothetical protein
MSNRDPYSDSLNFGCLALVSARRPAELSGGASLASLHRDAQSSLHVRFGFHGVLLSLLSNANHRPSLCHLKSDSSSFGSS